MQRTIRFVPAALYCVIILAGCYDGVGGETRDAAVSDAGVDGGTIAGCDGITCSGHGACALFNGEHVCSCDKGYNAEGLACLPIILDGGAGTDAGADGSSDAGIWDAGEDTGHDGGPDPCLGHCSNGIPDCSETDIDCGGGCMPCKNGKGCSIDEDCQSGHCVDNACTQGWKNIDLNVRAGFFDVAKDGDGILHIIWAQGNTLSYGQLGAQGIVETGTVTNNGNLSQYTPPSIAAHDKVVAVTFGTGSATSCNCGGCSEKIHVAFRGPQGTWNTEEVFSKPDCELYTFPSIGVSGDGGVHVFASCGVCDTSLHSNYRYRAATGVWSQGKKQGPYTKGQDFDSRMMTDDKGRVHLVHTVWCNPAFYQVAAAGAEFPDAAAKDRTDICLGGLAADNDDIHAIWVQYSGVCETNAATLKYAINSSNGFQIQNDIKLLPMCGDFNMPSLAISRSGELFAAWAEDADGDLRGVELIKLGRKSRGSREWQIEQITADGGTVRAVTPKVAVVGDTPFVFWRNSQGNLTVSTY